MITFVPMRSRFIKIGCAAVLAIYVLAYAGFGIHYCKSGNDACLVMMTGDYSSESVHKHIHSECHCNESHCAECHNHEGVHFHDPSCHTLVYALTSSQVNDGDTRLFSPDYHIVEYVSSVYGMPVCGSFGYRQSNPVVPDIRSHTFFSVWRI